MSSEVFRTLDAAANRSREGLRVIEDFVRFQGNDSELSRALKELRHQLTTCLTAWRADEWIAFRDTPGDVGTLVSTAAESRRDNVGAVVRANCKRVGEALRTLEEFGKTLNADIALQVEQLRYRFYTLEQRATELLFSRQTIGDRRLYLLVTESLCQLDWVAVVKAALQGGVGIVQLRERHLDGAELLRRACLVRELTRAAGALFIMNDRPDVAVLSQADGVHLGQDDLPVSAARRLCGAEMLVGVSTHSVAQLRQAVKDGANYVGLGPVFRSQTKQFSAFAGLDYLRAANAETELPAFAIGGIELHNLADVTATGVSRVAVSSVICRSVDPAGVAAELHANLYRAS